MYTSNKCTQHAGSVELRNEGTAITLSIMNLFLYYCFVCIHVAARLIMHAHAWCLVPRPSFTSADGLHHFDARSGQHEISVIAHVDS